MRRPPVVSLSRTVADFPHGQKIGNFLDCYADCLDIPIWASSKVTGAKFDEATQRWTVSIERKGLGSRELHPRHFVS